MAYAPSPPISRFETKYVRIPESGCWLWTGTAGRYGKFGMTPGQNPIDAHRASWLLYRGEIPAGFRVCHHCDVTLCVNPDHLFIGTAKENTRDMMRKGRHRFGTWNAPRGNNHWTKKGTTNGL